MIRVDFYLLEQTTAGIFPFACRLLQKIVQASTHVFIALNNLPECDAVNKLLWTFNDTSFLPHCLVTDAVAEQTPIHLGLISQLNNHSLVLNLTSQQLLNIPSLTRIIEIVPNETEPRQLSRQKYSAYKNQGFELYTHKIV